MLKKLLFVIAIATLVTSNLQAQSGSKQGSGNKGSGNKGSGSSSYNSGGSGSKEARAMEQAIDKMASKIARTDFAGISLDKTQRGTLKSLTEANYQQITSLNAQIGQLIPKRGLSKLQKTYKTAIKEGKSEKDAMIVSMEVIGLPSDVQEKILKLSESKMELMGKITMGVKETLTEEQSAILAEKMAMKEEKMKEAAGSGTQAPAGSGTQAPAGSGTQAPAGSGTQAPAGSGTQAPAGSGTQAPAGSGTQAPAGSGSK